MRTFGLSQRLPFLGILLCLAAPALGATYYIDLAGGNDSDSGESPGSAWRTIPGTRTWDGLRWLRTDYGRGKVNKFSPLKPGTVLALKRGKTHRATNGGYIWINDYFYGSGASFKNPISIMAADGWGTGPITFDGSLIPATMGMFVIQQDGIRIDGRGTDGICIKNSPVGGLMIKEQSGSNDSVDQCALVQMKFYNNGWVYLTDLAGSGAAQLNVRKADGLWIEKVTLDGNDNFVNGLILGDNHKSVVNARVVNSKAYDHRGALEGNDSGIGFKAFNSQVEFSGNIARNNLKGFDLGEQRGDNVDITYKLINCTSYNNYWGANLNCTGSSDYTGRVNFYVINSLIYRNSVQGINAYAGPFNLHIVHSVFANNGGTTTSSKATGHVRITPTSLRDDGAITARLYNNIFYQAHHTALTTSYFNRGVNSLTLDSDYNAYIQTGPAWFFRWAFFNKGEARDFDFGENGSGNPLGEWARYYGKDAEVPESGMTGHLDCDTHSMGTGAENSILPEFVDVQDDDFRLQFHCPGANLEAQPWFIPEMASDKLGVTRVAWDVGAFEAAD